MSTPLILALIVFVLVFLLKVPLALGMLAAGFTYLAASGGNLSVIANGFINSYYSGFTIIAVPLFIFTANVMNSGKITRNMFDFCDVLVGRFRGGMAHVNVLASLVFAGMTGSAVADVSGLGKIEIQAMTEEGYDPEFSCAVTASSAVLGPIFPPSQIMLIYSMITGASVGSLFLGGVIPAIVIAICLMVYITYIAKKRNYPYGTRYTIQEALRVTLKAIPALLTPVILLGGIYTGVFTPTEAAAVAGLYSIVVAIFVYRMVGFKDLLKIIEQTAVDVGRISIIVGAASALKYVVTREKIADMLGTFLVEHIASSELFLLAVILLFLFLGMFLETSTIILVVVPILMPALHAFNIDLVHFGIVSSICVMIGLCTPPYGSCLFITSAVSGAPLKSVIRETLPFVAMLIVALLIVTYCPVLVSFVPSLMG